jgi:hypothetical protein
MIAMLAVYIRRYGTSNTRAIYICQFSAIAVIIFGNDK